MLRLAHGLVVFLLVFTGLTAMGGGFLLIADPEGDVLGLSRAMLWHTPFSSFRLPGIILFGALGLGSLLTAARAGRRAPLYPYYVMVQGVLIYGFIVTEMILIRHAHPFQLLYAFIGVGLFELGAWLARRDARRDAPPRS